MSLSTPRPIRLLLMRHGQTYGNVAGALDTAQPALVALPSQPIDIDDLALEPQAPVAVAEPVAAPAPRRRFGFPRRASSRPTGPAPTAPADAITEPIAIVAASDVIAMSALRALSEFGLAVPGDVHVIGYDGLAICEQTVPRLSTVSQDLTQGAHHLVDMLLRRIAGEDTQSVVMEPQLVVRMSS